MDAAKFLRIELRLHADVKSTIKVVVSSSNPPPAVVAAHVAEAAKTEKKSSRVAAGRKGESVGSDPRPAKK